MPLIPVRKGIAAYRKNLVFASLGVMEEIFPVCHGLLGERNFNYLCREYVRAEPSRRSSLRFSVTHLRLISAGLLIGAVALGIRLLGLPRCGAIAAYFDAMDWHTSLCSFVAYVFATVALLPGSILTLVAGMAFGAWQGFVIVVVSAMFGITLTFFIARHLRGDSGVLQMGSFWGHDSPRTILFNRDQPEPKLRYKLLWADSENFFTVLLGVRLYLYLFNGRNTQIAIR